MKFICKKNEIYKNESSIHPALGLNMSDENM